MVSQLSNGMIGWIMVSQLHKLSKLCKVFIEERIEELIRERPNKHHSCAHKKSNSCPLVFYSGWHNTLYKINTSVLRSSSQVLKSIIL